MFAKFWIENLRKMTKRIEKLPPHLIYRPMTENCMWMEVKFIQEKVTVLLVTKEMEKVYPTLASPLCQVQNG